MTWLRKSLVTGVGALALYALFLGATHLPIAHALSCTASDFVCPGNYGGPGGDGQWDGDTDPTKGIILERTNGANGSHDSSLPTTTPAGTTFNYTVHYHVNQPTSYKVDTWVLINSNVGTTGVNITGEDGGALVNNVCGGGGGGVVLGSRYCSPPGDPEPYYTNSNYAPYFYYDDFSHYSPGPHAGYGGPPGAPYRPGVDPDFGDELNPNGGGQSIIWPGTNNSGGSVDLHFSIQIPYSATNQKISVRAYLSVQEHGNQDLPDIYSRSSPQEFQVKPTGFDGYVQSDPTAATGRVLSGVPINLSDCGSTVIKQVTTNSSGYYQFPAGSASTGQGVCIAPAGPFPAVYDGSPYGGQTPSNGYNTQCGVVNGICGNYNFLMLPYQQPLPSAKASNPSSGTSIVPGQSMNFSMSAYNPYDDNTGGGAHQAQLDDEIPLNIDPSSVNSISASLSADNNPSAPNAPPWNWSVAQSFVCNGLNNFFWYGVGNNHVGTYRCGYSAPSGTTPGYVYVIMTNMPAYSQVNLSWAGTTKTAQYVGVFPSNGAYCNSSAVNFGDSNSVLANCSDFSVGLQGVSNFAYTAVGDDSTLPQSNTTYNPIPGQLASVGKDTTAQLLNPAAGLTSLGPSYCDAQTPNTAGDPNNRWVYSPTTAGYSTAQFTVHVCPDFSKGPVYYYVTDQDDGSHGPTSGSLSSGQALDPALRNVTSWDAPGTYAASVLRWGNIRSTNSAATHQNYNFNVAFSDQGNGHVAYNGVKACWPQYWNAPSSPGNYATSCVNTAIPMSVTQESITYPFVSSANGDIHAGGGPSQLNGSNNCTTPSGPIETGQNPGAQGQYFVTASGNLDITSKQQFFNSTAGTKSTSYGTVCRPDLVTSTANYIAQNPTQHVSLALYGNTIPADQYAAGWDGKVVEAYGDVTIPANLVINARFTLLVHNGNLNIRGNVTTQSTTAPGPYGTPVDVSPASFGVVMDSGNIYIDKNVSQLAGFYYAAPTPNSAANGVINTCSGPDGRPALQAVPGPAYSVADCSTNQLVVQGLMMAYGFRLDRTRLPNPSTGSNSGDAAEYVQFDNRLYTATPPGFSDLGQTYLPPIYLPRTNPRY